MSFVIKDLLHGFRRILRQPKYSLVAILTLAVGLGANIAIFSVLNGVLLRPLPYEDPEDLVLVWSTNLEEGWKLTTLSYPDFEDWTAQAGGFEELGVFAYRGVTLTGSERPQRLQAARVSADLFQALGVEPIQGRLFSEGSADEEQVVVLSHETWRQSFGSDPSVTGEVVQVDGEPYTVIGVMPARFSFPPEMWFEASPLPHPIDLWMPVGSWADQFGRGSRLFFAAGRLAPGVEPSRVEADLNTVATRLASEYPNSNRGWTVTVESLPRHVTKHVRPALVMFGFAVALILLLACANVTNLLMAQAADREGEVAVRSALGSRRWDLVRGRLVETLMLTLIAAAVGLWVAKMVTDVLVSVGGEQVPRLTGFTLDGLVIAFTFAITIVLGIALGLLPLAHLINPRVAQVLKEGGRSRQGGPRARRLRQVLVAFEAGIAVVLLAGAAQALSTYGELNEVDPGFDQSNLGTARLALPRASYPEIDQVISFHRRLAERLEAVPGVRSAAWANNLPLGDSLNSGFQIPDRPPASPGENLQAEVRSVSPDYFETLGIPAVSGRIFRESDDRHGGPVAVINQRMARQFWPERDPVGLEILIEPFPGSGRGSLEVDRVARIVGVVRDVRQSGPGTEAGPTLYVPYLQDPTRETALAYRTDRDPEAVVSNFREAVWAIDPNLPIEEVQTMEERLQGSLGQPRFRALLLGVFSIAALVLAVTGIYSIVSYSASQRRLEMGIRLSFGARRRDIVRSVLVRGMIPVLIGLAAGLAIILAAGWFFEEKVVELGNVDPLALVVVPVGVLLVALLANLLPAVRLSRVAPAESLRQE